MQRSKDFLSNTFRGKLAFIVGSFVLSVWRCLCCTSALCWEKYIPRSAFSRQGIYTCKGWWRSDFSVESRFTNSSSERFPCFYRSFSGKAFISSWLIIFPEDLVSLFFTPSPLLPPDYITVVFNLGSSGNFPCAQAWLYAVHSVLETIRKLIESCKLKYLPAAASVTCSCYCISQKPTE